MINEHSPIIDFHTHAFNDKLAARVMQEMEVQTNFSAHYNGTVSGLLNNMQSVGIDQAVIQPVATKPEQVQPINQWGAIVNEHDQLNCFGALHPNLSKLALDDALGFIKDHDFKGVKLHPEYQDFYPDDDRLAYLYEKLESHKLILLLHSGRDLCFTSEIKATPKRLIQIHQAYPQLKLVLAHLGGFQLWDEVEQELIGKNLWLDTAYCAGYCDLKKFEKIVEDHGSEYILFGSDAPWGDQKSHLDFIKNANISAEEKNRILGANALQLLG